ncbi:MAG: amidohydrolase family protein [Burkholderiaceae bacterium]
MSIYDEPKIDCHNHVLDPRRFPYAADTAYRPAGQEISPAAQMLNVMDAYGVGYSLVVGPNSGYGSDNRCLLDAIAHSQGRFKGVAVVEHDIALAELQQLKDAGVVGVAFNPSLHGVAYYLQTAPLLTKLAELDLFIQIQVERNQLVELAPLLERCDARMLIDHCGRPDPAAGLAQPGFAALLALGRSRRASIKLSGYGKFSQKNHPFADSQPFVRALIDAFTLERCVWGSDWPFLKAAERIDYGPLLKLVEQLLPDASDRRKLLWDTPRKLFGFESSSA